VAVFIGNGDGTFQLPGGSPSHISGGMCNPKQVVLTDLNGDAIPDLVVVNSGSNDFTTLMGKGDGNFYNAQRFLAGSYPSFSVTVGAFFGQTIPDVAVLANEYYGQAIVVLKNGSPH
jgi:hypothetical protein